MIKSVKIQNLQKLTIPRIGPMEARNYYSTSKEDKFYKNSADCNTSKEKKNRIIITTHTTNKLNSITMISFT